MSAQASEAQGEPQRIRLGGEEAAVIPIAEYLRLKAIERHATAEEVAAAELEAEIAEDAPHRARYLEWVAAGRPGAVTQEEMEQAFAGSARL